ncbi:hypothetical protein E2C01_046653 [Portunus trituberculatus]|uniref:Uncharacterized protein n=1 Tax=Portunus trituberculatus TaxID=210409 RepID=A0A5B7G5N2_PORTR|nr:hypothetical protein [Portunus trituberculatus]
MAIRLESVCVIRFGLHAQHSEAVVVVVVTVVAVVVRGEDKVSLPHIPRRDGRQSATAAPMSLHGKCPAATCTAQVHSRDRPAPRLRSNSRVELLRVGSAAVAPPCRPSPRPLRRSPTQPKDSHRPHLCLAATTTATHSQPLVGVSSCLPVIQPHTATLLHWNTQKLQQREPKFVRMTVKEETEEEEGGRRRWRGRRKEEETGVDRSVAPPSLLLSDPRCRPVPQRSWK